MEDSSSLTSEFTRNDSRMPASMQKTLEAIHQGWRVRRGRLEKGMSPAEFVEAVNVWHYEQDPLNFRKNAHLHLTVEALGGYESRNVIPSNVLADFSKVLDIPIGEFFLGPQESTALPVLTILQA